MPDQEPMDTPEPFRPQPDFVRFFPQLMGEAQGFFALLKERQIEVTSADGEWWWSLPTYGIEAMIGYPTFGLALFGAMRAYTHMSERDTDQLD